ncbi:DUF4893 domain-containing protein [Taklimakanibacter lacteus]|uniref:DUF4893 domain-containing protein n=1 Tax=Taklimakanibacter lacteus TaxID=2268456 RepID=UPI0034D532F9
MRGSFHMLTRYGVFALVMMAASITAHADGEIGKLMTAADKQRLAAFDKTRAEAIAEAKKGGAPEDVATLEKILAGKDLSFSESFDFTGNWRCRTVKLGGNLPLIVYGWFKCRVTDDGSGWKLEKLTGSQRTSGAFYTDSGTRLIYIGAAHYADEKPKRYASDPDRDEVAYVLRPDENRVRLEFPLPKYESKLDIIELIR